jgi:hypothetical protein
VPATTQVPLKVLNGAKWSGPWAYKDKALIDGLVNDIPDTQGGLPLGQAFKKWVSANNVEFKAGLLEQSGPTLGVTPRQLQVNQAFFNLHNTEQKNVLTFELAKALWYSINDNDSHVAKTPDGRDFQRLIDHHPAAMNAMKSGGYGSAPLGDFADIQSQFGYAVRVAVFNLGPPATTSAKVVADWQNARQEIQQYLMKIMSGGR